MATETKNKYKITKTKTETERRKNGGEKTCKNGDNCADAEWKMGMAHKKRGNIAGQKKQKKIGSQARKFSLHYADERYTWHKGRPEI